ncbi:MAG: hypothetical protein ACPL7K_05525, partial [Armatimonadota bacterium]
MNLGGWASLGITGLPSCCRSFRHPNIYLSAICLAQPNGFGDASADLPSMDVGAYVDGSKIE